MKFKRVGRYRNVGICGRCSSIHERIGGAFCDACGFQGSGPMIDVFEFSIFGGKYQSKAHETPALRVVIARPVLVRRFPLFWKWRIEKWEIAATDAGSVDALLSSL